MKIIDHQEAATQQIISQPRRFLLVQVPVTDFDCIDPREVVDVFVEWCQDTTLFGGRNACQAVDAFQKMVFRFRPVGLPHLATPAIAAIAVCRIREAHELKFPRRFPRLTR